MLSLHHDLEREISGLLDRKAASRTVPPKHPSPAALPSLPPAELRKELESIWSTVSGQSSNHWEIIRTTLEVVGREVVVEPLFERIQPSESSSLQEQGRLQTDLQDRLDVILTLYEVVYAAHPDVHSLEPGALFIPLVEELVELISLFNWRELFSYVETRSPRFTKNMPASKGKALPLLRMINTFLRILSRTPEDLIFRGRIHIFSSSVINIADKSAINMRGDYGELKTTWEDAVESEVVGTNGHAEADSGEEVKGEEDGDVKMADEQEGKAGDVKGEEVAKEAAKPEPNFYATLWSLQQYFASPPSLAGKPVPSFSDPSKSVTPMEDFQQKSDFVLPKIFEQTTKDKELAGKEVETGLAGTKRKFDEVENEGFFYPRYLTGKRLFEYELADMSFRRQILVQYFMLFQFLLNLVPSSASKQAFIGGMPKSFIVSSEGEVWVRAKISEIKKEMQRMPGDGTRFHAIVLAIIMKERHYAAWKNDGCPEDIFEKKPRGSESAHTAADAWKKLSDPYHNFNFQYGTRSLTEAMRNPFDSLDRLKAPPKQTSIETLLDDIDEKERSLAEIAAGEQDADSKQKIEEQIVVAQWRAMRSMAQTNLTALAPLVSKRDIRLVEPYKARYPETKEAEPAVEAEAAADEVDGDLAAGPAETGEEVTTEGMGGVEEGTEVKVETETTETLPTQEETSALSVADVDDAAAHETAAQGTTRPDAAEVVGTDVPMEKADDAQHVKAEDVPLEALPITKAVAKIEEDPAE